MDQVQLVPDWSEKELNTGSDLLKAIIEALETRTMQWPGMSQNLMMCQEWIQKMKFNAIFYPLHAKKSEEMQAYERLLLDLASSYLKRTIILHPFMEDDQQLTFPQESIPEANPPARSYHLMYVNKVCDENFYLSLVPKKSS